MESILKAVDRKKAVIRIVLLLIVLCCVFAYQFYQLTQVQYQYFSYPKIPLLFAVCAVGSLIAIAALYFFTVIKPVSVDRLCLFFLIAVSLAYMIFFSPISIPDEQSHYMSAYRMSNYFLFRFKQFSTDEVIMRKVDLEFFHKISICNIVTEENYSNLIRNWNTFSFHNSLTTAEYPTVLSAPVGYIASAIGIAFGRILHLGSMPVFYCGRLFNMAAVIALVYCAMKKTPFGKMAMFSIAVLPMTMHLLASLSYDSVIIGLAMLFIAYVLFLAYGGEIRKRDVIIPCIIAFLLAPSKFVYTPIIFTALIIPSERLRGTVRRPWLLKAGIILCGIIGLFAIQYKMLFGLDTRYNIEWDDNYVEQLGSTCYNISWVLGHPAKSILIIFRTLSVNLDMYFVTSIGASLGWFQISIPMFIYMPFVLLLLLSFMKRRNESDSCRYISKLWLLLIVLGTSLLILVSLFLGWTPMNQDCIGGVQGRYFLPILPVLILILRNNLIVVDEKIDHHIVFLSGVFSVMMLSHAFMFVFCNA